MMNCRLAAVWTILTAFVFTFLLPPASSMGQVDPSAAIILISPPPGVLLPAGQALEVRYRVVGRVGEVEIAEDGDVLATDHVQQGQVIRHVWVSETLGIHCLGVRVPDEKGTWLTIDALPVTVLPRREQVHVGYDRPQTCAHSTLLNHSGLLTGSDSAGGGRWSQDFHMR